MDEAAGHGYQVPDFSNGMFEAVQVLVDEQDQPIMAAAAERIVQLYLLCGDFSHPAAKLAGIRMLHEAMRPELRDKGYRTADAFIPPEVEKSFGRRLIKTFGWCRNWASFCVRV